MVFETPFRPAPVTASDVAGIVGIVAGVCSGLLGPDAGKLGLTPMGESFVRTLLPQPSVLVPEPLRR